MLTIDQLSLPPDTHDVSAYLRKLAVSDQIAYRAFLQFYKEYCPSPNLSVVEQQHPNAQPLSAGITAGSREVIALWQRDIIESPDPITGYELHVHDIESTQHTSYLINQKTVIDTKNGDFRQYVGDAIAIEFEATATDAELPTTASLLVSNRGSVWSSSRYGAPQLPGDVRLLPYQIEAQIRNRSSVHYVGAVALQGLILLPNELSR